MFLKRFVRDVSAVAAVEFAIIAPLMILSYFGLAEVTSAMIAQRRISHAGATIGDLVAQSSTTTKAQIADIFTVGTVIVSPFPTTPLQMRVSGISANAAGAATVTWSEGSNMGALGKGSSATVPKTVLGPSASIVRADVAYVYSSPVNYLMTKPIIFNYTYYLKPRISDSVVCSDC